MKLYKIDQYFEFTFQTQTFATGAAADADATPTYRTYEENNDTVLDSGNCAKRDDANTTGFYYVRGQCTAALGYEVGKTYEVRAAATVASVSGACVVGRFGMIPDQVWDSLYGGTDLLDANASQLGGTAQTGRDVGASVLVGDKTGFSLAAGQLVFKKNVARPNFAFPMFDSAGALKTGLTVTAAIRKDAGASFAALAGSVTEIGTTGWYTVDWAQAETNADTIAFSASASGANPTTMTILTQA